MSMAEVLVALFLMALGSIAILTMFPLGMFHMGQALKDDRTAQSAAQADAFMRSIWRTNVVQTNAGEPFASALDNPDSQPDFVNATPFPAKGQPNLTNVPVPSYPVVVDPMGYIAPWQGSAALQFWLGNTGYPRRSLLKTLPAPGGAASPQRVCSLMDGYGFAENGTANGLGGGNVIERELRYNWLWIIQRPNNSVRNVASMTVVVFDKRAYLYAPLGTETVFVSGVTGGTTIVMVPLLTSIQIPYSQGVPAVQKSGWIMDATPSLNHAIFYRVVSVTDNPANGTTDLEVQTPIRRLDGGTGSYAGTLIYMAGVSEVFERPNLTPNDF
jgi:hypothetical protein